MYIYIRSAHPLVQRREHELIRGVVAQAEDEVAPRLKIEQARARSQK